MLSKMEISDTLKFLFYKHQKSKMADMVVVVKLTFAIIHLESKCWCLAICFKTLGDE